MLPVTLITMSLVANRLVYESFYPSFGILYCSILQFCNRHTPLGQGRFYYLQPQKFVTTVSDICSTLALYLSNTYYVIILKY